ncbi:MAG: TIGR03905 family TSCPD domain-containing protein [Paraclostridium sp.]|uniref:TIGR03905 family TSCPD domain-containing protein n=1 Tax=Paraclostridium sp. TaxID=2023273 RepID=UPI003062F605
MKVTVKPSGVCCKEIVFDIDDNDIVTSVDFVGGCPGNLIGLKHLIEGRPANEIADKLEGIPCGVKSTSCPDQLSKALREQLSK